jgi:hypothetical protein
MRVIGTKLLANWSPMTPNYCFKAAQELEGRNLEEKERAVRLFMAPVS